MAGPDAAGHEALALHNAGVDLLAAGQLDAAASRFAAALDRDPGLAESCFNLALIRQAQQRLDEAVALYWQTVALAPGFAGAHTNLAVALRGLGRPQEALHAFRRAASLDPGNAAAWTNLADMLRETKAFDEAIEAYGKALAPGDDAAIRFRLAGCHLELGRFKTALDELERVLDRRHDFVEAHVNRGIALRHLERHEELLRSYELALALKADHLRALLGMGDTLFEMKRKAEAEAVYRRARSAAPDDPNANDKLGVTLLDRDRIDEALPFLYRAVRLDPTDGGLLSHVADAMCKLDRYDEAVEIYRDAAALDPAQHTLWCNYGLALHETRRYREALDCYGKALQLKPDAAVARYNEAAVRLLLGDFAGGWEGYEWRKRPPYSAGIRRELTQPEWTGAEPLAGSSILVHAEQGLGDTLHFARYLPLLADRGASVVAAVQPALLPVLGALDPRVTILAGNGALPACDLRCALLSLPHRFGTRLDTIPAAVPYLTAPAERRAAWQERLPQTRRRRVGLAWAGNPEHAGDRHRSAPLALLAPLLEVPGIEFVSLQKQVPERDRDAYAAASSLCRLGETLEDFGDTAGLMARLDLVIAVDTAVAHLAGGLGRPLWLLVSYLPEWRWLTDREDSPWYPTARLFRQRARGDWTELAVRVAAALESLPAT